MRILVLSTWFPYPLSQGSKIRAYHLIKSLAERHEVALISFEDSPLQPDWLDAIRAICAQVEVIARDPFHYTIGKKIQGWLSFQPSSVVASYSQEMAQGVERLVREWHPDCIFAITFVTAPYVRNFSGLLKVVDVDYLMAPTIYEENKHKDLAHRLRNPLTYWKFREFERRLYHQFDGCLVVSQRDRQAIEDVIQIPAEKIKVISNGVDTSFHRPSLRPPEPNTLVFNGSINYDYNRDGIDYFLKEIFPLILAKVPQVRLKITGKKGQTPLESLSRYPQVELTGYLDDIRPIVSESWACVVPLRLGGGTRLKILEAMALGVPVVSTSKGAEGLDVISNEHLLIADSAEEFANLTVKLLCDPDLRAKISLKALSFVRENYDWKKIGGQLSRFIESLDRSFRLKAD